MEVDQETRGRRILALDGLRGATIILVVLTHSWLVYPKETIEQVPVLRGLFHGGSVTVFFVIGGFIVTGNLLRERGAGVLDPVRFYLRRIVRIGVHLVPLAVAILVVHHIDPTDTSSDEATNRSLVSALTYTWNTFLVDHALDARPDLGHLWYLSVQQQAYLVLPLTVILLAAHRKAFAVLLAAATVAVVVHRYGVLAADGLWPASLLTTTRADGLLLGALLAVGLPWVAPLLRERRWVATACAAALVVLVIISPEIPEDQYLREWGVGFTLLAALLVAALVVGPTSNRTSRALSRPVMRSLGDASLAIYVWHYPLFWMLARHTATWSGTSRTAAAVLLLVLIVAAAQRFIDRPARRWLASSSLFRAPRVPLPADAAGAVGDELPRPG